MNRPKYVIFDCDGVLVDSEIIANRIEAEVKTELGFPTTVEEQIRTFVGMGMNHPVMQQELKRLPSNYWSMVDERIRKSYPTELKAIAGVLEVVQKLKLPKCVASSSEPDWLEIKLRLTGLEPYFLGATFHGQLVKRSKPEPDIFLHAIETMGWTAQDCLVIEDSELGVKAGRAAGALVCGFLGGAHIQKGHADKLLNAGADFVVSDITKLLRLVHS